MMQRYYFLLENMYRAMIIFRLTCLVGYPRTSAPEPVKPVLFDEHTIIIPMFFWVASTTDAIQEELKRHSFMLVYDSNGNSDSNLGVCLLHNVSDDEYRIRTLYTVQYCAFDIASAISRFESEKGNKPSRMTIEYKVNSLSDRLEDARIEKYTLDYKFQ